MALKYKYSKAEEIPAALASSYMERDGAHILDVEGAVEGSRYDDLAAAKLRLERERDQLSTRLNTALIDSAALEAARVRGLRPAASTDLILRARSELAMVNGHATVMGADNQPKPGGDGKKPMTVEEWVEGQMISAAHLFDRPAGNSGTGAAGNPAASATTGTVTRNPWSKAHWNRTEQMKLLKSDPALAATLERQAM